MSDILLSVNDFSAMAGMDELMNECHRAELQQKQDVLLQVKSMVSAEVYSDILEELAESGSTDDFQIVLEAVGQEQDDDASWGTTYVNQTTNGGYTGDEYSGTVSIPLGNNKFIQFAYYM